MQRKESRAKRELIDAPPQKKKESKGEKKTKKVIEIEENKERVRE